MEEVDDQIDDGLTMHQPEEVEVGCRASSSLERDLMTIYYTISGSIVVGGLGGRVEVISLKWLIDESKPCTSKSSNN